eukprot:222850-Chlamydomonas_euryale.AAC.7
MLQHSMVERCRREWQESCAGWYTDFRGMYRLQQELFRQQLSFLVRRVMRRDAAVRRGSSRRLSRRRRVACPTCGCRVARTHPHARARYGERPEINSRTSPFFRSLARSRSRGRTETTNLRYCDKYNGWRYPSLP